MTNLNRELDNLLEKYHFKNTNSSLNINLIIRDALNEFKNSVTEMAIWANGTHTKMLMSDFMNELKSVRWIIDKSCAGEKDSGFKIIRPDEILDKGIDGVIISSYDYHNEIKNSLINDFKNVKYLDIYDMLQEKGILMEEAYYHVFHPYGKYNKINKLIRECKSLKDVEEQENVVLSIVNQLLLIKDLRTALLWVRKLKKYSDKDALEADIAALYKKELQQIEKISKDNVLMLCLDGMRRNDIYNEMENLSTWIKGNTHYYTNAYSVSTSTYESLIPAYSENCDMRTKYYEQLTIPEENCRFISEVKKQKRSCYFYTDSDRYVDSDIIHYVSSFQTATEKIWSFVNDAKDIIHGLFYLHILYESHYSYPNPYTEEKLVADGSSIMFDFLSGKGGKLRTDYEKQHKDTLNYLEDILMDFLPAINCNMVIYADHGNILMNANDTLENLEDTKYSYHEDLIQIPIILKTPEMKIGRDDQLISLMELNNIVIAMLNNQSFDYQPKKWIKTQRSAIYNPDFRYLYTKNGKEQELYAFETFVFEDRYKLAVYENGMKELYSVETDEKVQDDIQIENHYQMIQSEITLGDIQ